MTTINKEDAKVCVDTIKILAVEAIEKANSGHPGAPMGCADMAFVLWSRFLRFNPDEPAWFDRDRFILSNGHASMLLYSLLHLFEYPLTLDEIKNFRQLHSLTPGHPEYGLTPGVEVTSGPLGQGISTAVGMALSAKMAEARFNKGGRKVINHRIFGICGDGCLMEGVTSEAVSMAGHLGLGNLVFLYDDNSITIEGSTNLAFTEDVRGVFESRGWQVLEVDGHDHEAIAGAIESAIAETGRPSLIKARTKIAKGSPTKEGSHKTHGSPLGAAEIEAFKKAAGWPAEAFHVPEAAKKSFGTIAASRRNEYRAWKSTFDSMTAADPELAGALASHLEKTLPQGCFDRALAAVEGLSEATRSLSGRVINALAPELPWLAGGSADLAPSNNTMIAGSAEIGAPSTKDDPFGGRNIHFGVREHAMGAALNGMALHGFFKPYGGTFLTFSDYCRPAIRLACLMKTGPVFIFTHDSIFLGEDGPTHQAVEHLAALRAIPGMTLFRPADGIETAMAWKWALVSGLPCLMALTRQKCRKLDRPAGFKPEDVLKGGYVVKTEGKGDFNGKGVIILASGSEVALGIDAAVSLEEKGIPARVVSMASTCLFDRQDQAYRDSIIPPSFERVVSVEAAVTMGWHKYVGRKGLAIGIDRFGESAPDTVLAEFFGLTPKQVVERILGWL